MTCTNISIPLYLALAMLMKVVSLHGPYYRLYL